jgi:phage host-nuclease inhibitor protein Gam
MALEKTTVEDKIEIVGDFKHVQVRTATVISEDNVEISRSYHRHVVAPDADITGESAEVQAICAAVHTQAVKDAYAAHIAAQAAEMAPAEETPAEGGE